MFLKSLFFLFFLAIQVSGQNNRTWATYYGGPDTDYSNNITTDRFGNIYLVGTSGSSVGIASNGFQNTYGGGVSDAFLVKFDSLGNRLWATYYGGGSEDRGCGVVTDSIGNVFLCGWTTSGTGISFNGFQNVYGGNEDAFIVKFDGAGNRIWATYYGGIGLEYGQSIAVDRGGNIYLGDITLNSPGLASGGFQNVSGGAYDAYLVKFDSNGNRLWATYYGGSSTENGFSVATDRMNNIYLAGTASSNTGISFNGFQNSFGGGNVDAFLVKFSPSGTRLWATYYGGTGDESNYGIGQTPSILNVDPSGNIYMGGYTTLSSGISSSGFQNSFGGGFYDCFLVKFNSNGNRLWGTYYGGNDNEETFGVATDISGNVYLSGDSYSGNAIASAGFQNNLIGLENTFIAKFDSMGLRKCATYFGQTHDEDGHVTIDKKGNIYLAGYMTSSTGISFGGFQNTYGGGSSDAFLAKFTTCLTTGIEESSVFSHEISPYPTLNNGSFRLQIENEIMNGKIILINSMGQKVYEQTVRQGVNIINANGLANGLYNYILFQDKKKIKNGKLIVD